MKKEKIEIYVFLLVGAVAAILLLSLLMKYILPALLPFIIAFFAAFAVKAPGAWLSKKTHISERIFRPALAVLGIIILISLFSLSVFLIGDFLLQLFVDITDYGKVYTALSRLSEVPYPIFGNLPEGLSLKLGECISQILVVAVEALAKLIASFAVELPEMLITIIITLVSVVYFAVDLERISSFVKSLFPQKYSYRLSWLGKRILEVLRKYVKSYLQMMGITFVVMLFGLVILGVESALAIAIIISVLDLLPILGVGAVLIPWSIFAFLIGESGLGVGLMVLFIAYTVLREAIEPKIFGKSLGVHPIITLISVYLGYAFFGFFGMVIFPVCAVLISGLFKKDKSAEVGEGFFG